jgi:hypothetical protein
MLFEWIECMYGLYAWFHSIWYCNDRYLYCTNMRACFVGYMHNTRNLLTDICIGLSHAHAYINMQLCTHACSHACTGKNAVTRLSMDASMRKFTHALCMQIMHTCVHSANMPWACMTCKQTATRIWKERALVLRQPNCSWNQGIKSC